MAKTLAIMIEIARNGGPGVGPIAHNSNLSKISYNF